MLNCIPSGHDTSITIVRTGGDSLTLYQYERYKIKLLDDHLLYYGTENEKPQKILYKNIMQIKWEPIFKEKGMKEVIEGEYKTKKTGE